MQDPRGEIETKNLEYALTKDNDNQIVKGDSSLEKKKENTGTRARER